MYCERDYAKKEYSCDYAPKIDFDLNKILEEARKKDEEEQKRRTRNIIICSIIGGIIIGLAIWNKPR